MSPTKVRRVVDLVRGMDVDDALATLKFAPQAASEPVYKVVASAAANAEQTDNLRARPICTCPRPSWTRASPCAGSVRGPRAAPAGS